MIDYEKIVREIIAIQDVVYADGACSDDSLAAAGMDEIAHILVAAHEPQDERYTDYQLDGEPPDGDASGYNLPHFA